MSNKALKRFAIIVILLIFLLSATGMVWVALSALNAHAQSPQAFEHGLNHKLENLPDGKVKWTGLPEVEYTEDAVTKEKNPRYGWGKEHKLLYNEKKYLKAMERYPAELAKWERTGSVEEDKPAYPEPAHFTEPMYEVIAGKDLKTGSQVRGASQQARGSIAEKFGQVGDFVWVDGVGGSGEIILPRGDYDHIYLSTGDWANPTITETDNYRVIDGRTHIYVDHFSGGGGVHETGKLVMHIEWEYDDTTFHDRSYYGLRFDGVDDYVDCGNDSSLFPQQLTFEVWIKTNSVSSTQHIGDSLQANKGYYFRIDNDECRLLLGDGAAHSVTTTDFNLVVDTWYHLVFTYDGATGKVYKNGTPSSDTLSWAGNVGAPAAQHLVIGSDNDGGIAFPMDGFLDEVRLYSRALEQPEITYNYYGGQGRYQPYSTTGLVGWWHLEENGSATATDSSGEGNNGTITGAIWVNGKVPKPIGTSGINDAYPTFRGDSSDPDVSAAMASWQPIEEAQAPPWVLETERDFWDTENITATGTFTTTPSPTAAPGVAVIEAIAAASATPSQLPYNVIAGFVILSVSITGSWFLAKYGSRNLWLKITLVTILMAICVAVRVFDFWMVVFFLIMAIAVALFSRRRSEG